MRGRGAWALAAILAGSAGCAGGSAASPEARSNKLNAGEEAVLHSDEGEFVYLGEGGWGIPVGTRVTVIEDAEDAKAPTRMVKIKAPASAVANGKGTPPAGGIEATIDRRDLRPIAK